jgi:hypothetical protein
LLEFILKMACYPRHAHYQPFDLFPGNVRLHAESGGTLSYRSLEERADQGRAESTGQCGGATSFIGGE